MLIIANVHKHTYIFMLRIYICISFKKWVYYGIKEVIIVRRRIFPKSPYFTLITLEIKHTTKKIKSQIIFLGCKKTRLVKKSIKIMLAPKIATTENTKVFTSCVSCSAIGNKTRVKTAIINTIKYVFLKNL